MCVIMLLYGILATVIIFNTVGKKPIMIEQMPARVQLMQASLDDIIAGKIPNPFLYSDSQQGFYIFAPYICYHVMGIEDAETVLEVCQNFYGMIFMSVIPLLIYMLCNSAALGLISPILVHLILGEVLYRIKMSPYYSLAWGAVLSFIVLSLLLKEKRKSAIWKFIVAECIIIAMSNFIRAGSVVACEAALVFVVIYKQYSIRFAGGYKLRNLLKSIFSVQAVLTVILMLVLSNTLERGAAKLLCNINGLETPNRQQQWHSLYIGLGFEENEFGIVYEDSCGLLKAQEMKPDVEYHSVEYFGILKNEYFKMWKENPGFVIAGYIKKWILCILYSIYFVLAYSNIFCIIGAFLYLGYCILIRKINIIQFIRLNWIYILLCIFIYFGGMLQGIMAIPAPGYIYGSISMAQLTILFLDLLLCLRICSKLKETAIKKCTK